MHNKGTKLLPIPASHIGMDNLDTLSSGQEYYLPREDQQYDHVHIRQDSQAANFKHGHAAAFMLRRLSPAVGMGGHTVALNVLVVDATVVRGTWDGYLHPEWQHSCMIVQTSKYSADRKPCTHQGCTL